MLALLIDADNLSATHADAILQWCNKLDRHVTVRIFGDFANGRGAEWTRIAQARGLELAFQPNGGAGKNSTDIALTIGAMDLHYENVVRGFCIASNDRDFVPLATRLRRSGRRIYAIGERLQDAMRAVCHETHTLPRKLASVSIPEDEPPLVQAFRKIAGEADRMSLAACGDLLRKHDPTAIPDGLKTRTALRKSGWFTEVGSGNNLTVVLKRPA